MKAICVKKRESVVCSLFFYTDRNARISFQREFELDDSMVRVVFNSTLTPPLQMTLLRTVLQAYFLLALRGQSLSEVQESPSTQ